MYTFPISLHTKGNSHLPMRRWPTLRSDLNLMCSLWLTTQLNHVVIWVQIATERKRRAITVMLKLASYLTVQLHEHCYSLLSGLPKSILGTRLCFVLTDYLNIYLISPDDCNADLISPNHQHTSEALWNRFLLSQPSFHPVVQLIQAHSHLLHGSWFPFLSAFLCQTCTSFIFHIHSLSICFSLVRLVPFPPSLLSFAPPTLLPSGSVLLILLILSSLFLRPPSHSLLCRHCLFQIPSPPLWLSLSLCLFTSLLCVLVVCRVCVCVCVCACAFVFVSVGLPHYSNSSSFYLQLP